MAEKIKSRRNASMDYWERREKEALKQTRASEEEFAEKIEQVYKDMRKDINDRINRWYIRYANDSEIDISEAKKRVSKLDIEEYAELAKKYVALSRSQETRAEAFTDEANEQMKIYNLTMKVNRLENLKAQMGLDLCGGFSRLQKNYGEFLTDQMMQEFTRQSGILGMTTTNPRRFRRQMEAIVNGSFHNATFSQRLWNQQDALKGELDRLLTRALIQGLNPRTVAPELKKKFDSSEQAADLLMITELCRVQTEAQKLAFQEFGYDDYTFICNGGACKECEALNGKHFKVKDMQAGRNAPPMHPRCRCSTAAYMDRAVFEKWLEEMSGVTQTDFKNDKHFLTYDDPVREKLGSAYESHPYEVQNLKQHLSEMGVTVNEAGTNMNYGPSPTPGRPGHLNIDPNASYSAWLHEYEHAKQDERSGWNGILVLMDPDEAQKWEDKAYDVEIEFANKMGYNKIVKRLQWLKGERRREVHGKERRK